MFDKPNSVTGAFYTKVWRSNSNGCTCLQTAQVDGRSVVEPVGMNLRFNPSFERWAEPRACTNISRISSIISDAKSLSELPIDDFTDLFITP